MTLASIQKINKIFDINVTLNYGRKPVAKKRGGFSHWEYGWYLVIMIIDDESKPFFRCLYSLFHSDLSFVLDNLRDEIKNLEIQNAISIRSEN